MNDALAQVQTQDEFPSAGEGQDDAPRVPLRPAYIQRLPDWIYDDPGFAALNAGQRYALHCLAWRADKPDGNGNVLGAFCGVTIQRTIGCGKSAFWEWLRAFERSGFAVVISRGGGRLGDVVGIPGRRGALDHRRVERRTTANGRGGAAPRKYDRPRARATDANASVRIADGCRPRNGRHPSGGGTAAVRESDTTITLGHLSNQTPAHRGTQVWSGSRRRGQARVELKPEQFPGFCQFWTLYPGSRRQDKTRMLTLWRDRGLEAIAGKIINGLHVWRASEQWMQDGGRYVASMANFLGGERWDNPPAPAWGWHGDPSDALGPGRNPTDEDYRVLYGDDD